MRRAARSLLSVSQLLVPPAVSTAAIAEQEAQMKYIHNTRGAAAMLALVSFLLSVMDLKFIENSGSNTTPVPLTSNSSSRAAEDHKLANKRAKNTALSVCTLIGIYVLFLHYRTRAVKLVAFDPVYRSASGSASVSQSPYFTRFLIEVASWLPHQPPYLGVWIFGSEEQAEVMDFFVVFRLYSLLQWWKDWYLTGSVYCRAMTAFTHLDADSFFFLRVVCVRYRWIAPLVLGTFSWIVMSLLLSDVEEDLPVADALYFVIITASTIGYGDITAKSLRGRAIVTVAWLGGCVVVGWIVLQVHDLLRFSPVEQCLYSILEQHRLSHTVRNSAAATIQAAYRVHRLRLKEAAKRAARKRSPATHGTSPTTTITTPAAPTATAPPMTEPTASEPTATAPTATEPTATEPTATSPTPTPEGDVELTTVPPPDVATAGRRSDETPLRHAVHIAASVAATTTHAAVAIVAGGAHAVDPHRLQEGAVLSAAMWTFMRTSAHFRRNRRRLHAVLRNLPDDHETTTKAAPTRAEILMSGVHATGEDPAASPNTNAGAGETFRSEFGLSGTARMRRPSLVPSRVPSPVAESREVSPHAATSTDSRMAGARMSRRTSVIARPTAPSAAITDNFEARLTALEGTVGQLLALQMALARQALGAAAVDQVLAESRREGSAEQDAAQADDNGSRESPREE